MAQGIAGAPAAARGQLAAASTSSFAGALNDILLIAAVVAFAGAAAALALIRSKDFVDASEAFTGAAQRGEVARRDWKLSLSLEPQLW